MSAPRGAHLDVEVRGTKVILHTDQLTRFVGNKLPTRVQVMTEMSPAVAERVAREIAGAAALARAAQRPTDFADVTHYGHAGITHRRRPRRGM